MSTVPEIARPSQLWKQLSAERRTQAAEAFWRDEHARAEQAEAIAMIAQRIKFRANHTHYGATGPNQRPS